MINYTTIRTGVFIVMVIYIHIHNTDIYGTYTRYFKNVLNFLYDNN